MIEHNGSLLETREESIALRSVLDWWKADCGWGRTTPVIDPEPPNTNGPTVFKINTEVARSASRRRARPHSKAYGLNSLGRKSHRKTEVPAQ